MFEGISPTNPGYVSGYAVVLSFSIFQTHTHNLQKLSWNQDILGTIMRDPNMEKSNDNAKQLDFQIYQICSIP